MATQWRLVVGLAGFGYQGLEHASIPLALEMAGVGEAARAAVLRGLKVMERAALPLLNGADAGT